MRGSVPPRPKKWGFHNPRPRLCYAYEHKCHLNEHWNQEMEKLERERKFITSTTLSLDLTCFRGGGINTFCRRRLATLQAKRLDWTWKASSRFHGSDSLV